MVTIHPFSPPVTGVVTAVVPSADRQVVLLVIRLGERVGWNQKPVSVHAGDPYMRDGAFRALQAASPLRSSDHRAVRATCELQV